MSDRPAFVCEKIHSMWIPSKGETQLLILYASSFSHSSITHECQQYFLYINGSKSRICISRWSSFRDRRYEYKGLNKVWKGKLGDAKASGNPIKIQEASVNINHSILSKTRIELLL